MKEGGHGPNHVTMWVDAGSREEMTVSKKMDISAWNSIPTNTLNEQGPSRRVPSPAKTLMLAQCNTHQTTDMYMNLCRASEL